MLDGTGLEGLYLSSLSHVDGSEAWSELCLPLDQLQDFPVPPLSKESFTSTVQRGEAEASQSIDLAGNQGLLGAVYLRREPERLFLRAFTEVFRVFPFLGET